MEETKYIMVGWPEIQDFMDYTEYEEDCFMCYPIKDANITISYWAVPEELYNRHYGRNKY